MQERKLSATLVKSETLLLKNAMNMCGGWGGGGMGGLRAGTDDKCEPAFTAIDGRFTTPGNRQAVGSISYYTIRRKINVVCIQKCHVFSPVFKDLSVFGKGGISKIKLPMLSAFMQPPP